MTDSTSTEDDFTKLQQRVRRRHDDWRRYRQIWQYIYYGLGSVALMANVALIALAQMDGVPRYVLTVIAAISAFSNGYLAFYNPRAKYLGYLRAEVTLKRALDLYQGKTAADALSILEGALRQAYDTVANYRIETEEKIQQVVNGV